MIMRRLPLTLSVILLLPLSAFCEPAVVSPAVPASTSSSTANRSVADPLREMQAAAISHDYADWGYWGPYPSKYTGWTNHSNRLIPVYTFGLDLKSVRGEHSIYRDAERLKQLYGQLPAETLNPHAEYFDQTDIFRLQQAAAAAGKRRIILFIFDGMDWQTTWAAATYRAGEVKYREGRGTGLHFQDYRGAPTDFGYMVTSPHNDGTKSDVDTQSVVNPGGKIRGGYDWRRAGETPWSEAADPMYPIAKSRDQPQVYTDSSASATSMTAGIKTFNDCVNVDFEGRPVETIAQKLQCQGWSVGAVTSVPFSHATPACAYANNVFRDDYQDLSRDMLGLRSASHREQPLAGLDVVIGTGCGDDVQADKAQGANFVPGNRYITTVDLDAIDVQHGGKYRVVQRTAGVDGRAALATAATEAAVNRQRLLGFFGAGVGSKNHLPFRTADGNFDPTAGANPAEKYTEADVRENPRLPDIARAALKVLGQNPNGFWLMIEAGDVDWGNHDDNIDDSIGAVLDGDDAVKAVTDWIETHGGWNDTGANCDRRPRALFSFDKAGGDCCRWEAEMKHGNDQ